LTVLWDLALDEVVHPLPQQYGASEDHAEHVIPLREPSELPEIDSIGVHEQLPTRDAPLDERLLDKLSYVE